jgi:hypothetical protein
MSHTILQLSTVAPLQRVQQFHHNQILPLSRFLLYLGHRKISQAVKLGGQEGYITYSLLYLAKICCKGWAK